MVHGCPLPSYKRAEINLSYCRITVIHSTEHVCPPHLTLFTHPFLLSYISSYTFPSPYFCLSFYSPPFNFTYLSFQTHTASAPVFFNLALSPRFSLLPPSLLQSTDFHFLCPDVSFYFLHTSSLCLSQSLILFQFSSNIGMRTKKSML